jgi:predicted Fe-Mo cluster-binding NifX family protein
MKISVASDGPMVAEHFGHCEGFTVYTVEGKNVEKKEFVQNPGHKPGLLPNLLHDTGVEVVIAGGMGQGAVDIFCSYDIRVITGADGKADDAVAAYLQGKLQSSGPVCHEHAHEGECGH